MPLAHTFESPSKERDVPYSEPGFVRRSSPKALQDYLAAEAPKVELLIDWSQPPAKVRKALIDCLHNLPRDDRVPIVRDWERVAELTDWRRQVREHRSELIVGAAVLGFAVGGLIALRRRR